MSLQHIGPIVRLSETDSTNRYLADAAREGAESGLVCVAGHQTSGRGRLGRAWEAPPGANLLVSVFFGADPRLSPHSLTVSVALAAADVSSKLTGAEVGLKWPNDLVADDVKLAGILAEVLADGRGVVVGLGLNVNWPAAVESGGTGTSVEAETPFEATSLVRLLGPRAPTEPLDTGLVLTGVLEHLDRRIDDLTGPFDLPDASGPNAPTSHTDPSGPDEAQVRLMEEYRSRCVTIGRQVRVEEMSGTTTGRAAGITDEGYLVVEVDAPDGQRVFTTGDVVHLRYDQG